jgi:effector-binding domain-containing protein
MIEPPHIAETAATHMAYIHIVVPRAEIQNAMHPGIKEILAVLAAQGISPTGPMFTHHLRVPTDTFDFELCMPVSTLVKPDGRVKPGKLPAATVARTVYHGGYEGLPDAWCEFMTWVQAEGHKAAPNLWECYIAGPESDPDPSTYRTELNRPIQTSIT